MGRNDQTAKGGEEELGALKRSPIAYWGQVCPLTSPTARYSALLIAEERRKVCEVVGGQAAGGLIG